MKPAHLIDGEVPSDGDDGWRHRLACTCGWSTEAGPFPAAVTAEQEAFRRYAEHAGEHDASPDRRRPAAWSEGLGARMVWEPGRRRRRTASSED